MSENKLKIDNELKDQTHLEEKQDELSRLKFEMEGLRKSMDLLQIEFYHLIDQRLQIAGRVWEKKVQMGLDFNDREREYNLIENFTSIYPQACDPTLAIYQKVTEVLINETKKYLTEKNKKNN